MPATCAGPHPRLTRRWWLLTLRSVFAQHSKEAVQEKWEQVRAMLGAKCRRAAELMAKASENVLALRHFLHQPWRKVWCNNLLKRVNKKNKRRTRVVGIFSKDAAIERLVGAVLPMQDQH